MGENHKRATLRTSSYRGEVISGVKGDTVAADVAVHGITRLLGVLVCERARATAGSTSE